MEQVEGRIINIQRFSIHDGPGIRTTVFLKGCNLRCLWCHNPESQHPEPQRMFYRHKCTNCGECSRVCEKAMLARCDNCGRCITVCQRGARELVGRKITAEALLAELMKDKSYYTTSNGGVTFSGGEPLLQPAFLKTVLKMCKEAGIHTAIETAGNVNWETISRLLPYTDLFLYDIKAVDSEVHKRCTGVENNRILENARELMQHCPEKLLFRMPVVPGYNDSQVAAAAAFTEGFPLELLPYHRTGIGKYDALGIPYELGSVEPPSAEMMQEFTETQEDVFWESNIV